MIKFLLPIDIYRHEIYFVVGQLEECKAAIIKDFAVEESMI